MSPPIDRLREAMGDTGPLAIAVSGGVDSLTLALAVGRMGVGVHCFHALSPAVPPRATQRVRITADREGWELREISAGEFFDPDYVSNPGNRCYFCKRNLYRTIRRHTDLPIASGTNTDDLCDYRPGLDAAKEFAVRHPFVEARISKAEVRGLAVELGYPDMARLPASPCLSSRVQTGIRIEAPLLRVIDQVEQWIAERFSPDTVRLRIRGDNLCVQLDETCLARLGEAERSRLVDFVRSVAPDRLRGSPVVLEAYRMGSAFSAESAR